MTTSDEAARCAAIGSLSEIFDAVRGDIHLYELGEVSYKSMLRGLRASVAALDAREVRRTQQSDVHASLVEALLEEPGLRLSPRLARALEEAQDALRRATS